MTVFNLKKIDYQYFLKSGKPELVVFAILADFKNQNPKAVIEDIVKELQKLSSGQLSLKKYTSQLRVLSKLRTFEKVTHKILTTMPLTFNVQSDVLFLKGKKIGEEIGKEIGEAIGEKKGKEIGEAIGEKKGKEIGEAIGKKEQAIITSMNMLLKTDFTIEQITDFSSADKAMVEQLKKELDKTDAKAIFTVYRNEQLTKTDRTKQQELFAKALLKMPTLSDKIIAQLAELEEKIISKWRKKREDAKK